MTAIDDRSRMQEIRARLAEQRKLRTDAHKAVKLAKEAGDVHAEAVAQDRVEMASSRIETDEALEMTILKQIAGISGGYSADSSSSFLNDPEQVSRLERLAHTNQKFSGVELGFASSAEQLCVQLNDGSWGQPKLAAGTPGVVPDSVVGRRGPFTELGIIPQPRRKLSLLDLIPTSPAEGNTVPYIVESGPFTGAAETAEGTVKPEMEIDLADGEVPVRTIANWIKANRQILADLPALQTVVQGRLSYSVFRRLEDQVVAGNGVGQNLVGIINTPGVNTVAYAAGANLADQSLAGLVAVLAAEGDADAMVLNSATLATLLTPKASGSGQYMNVPGPFSVAPGNLNLWGVPIVVSSLMPSGQILVGNFGQGARIWVREGVSVTAGLDLNDFTSNKITLLGEGRFALTITQPSFFSIVDLVSAPAGGEQ
jgi:hypothetical protein